MSINFSIWPDERKHALMSDIRKKLDSTSIARVLPWVRASYADLQWAFIPPGKLDRDDDGPPVLFRKVFLWWPVQSQDGYGLLTASKT